VRFSLDLLVPRHRFLSRFSFDLEVDKSVVGRVLVDLLEEDADLASRVGERVERWKSERS
jgi:hypothetical protein